MALTTAIFVLQSYQKAHKRQKIVKITMNMRQSKVTLRASKAL